MFYWLLKFNNNYRLFGCAEARRRGVHPTEYWSPCCHYSAPQVKHTDGPCIARHKVVWEITLPGHLIHSDQVDEKCPSTLILIASQSLLLENLRGDMKSLNLEVAIYGSKSECARTDTVFFPLSEVSTKAVTKHAIFSKIYTDKMSKYLFTQKTNKLRQATFSDKTAQTFFWHNKPSNSGLYYP